MRTNRDAFSLGAAGLAEGTAANTFKTTNPLTYVINGRSYLKAATDSIAFAVETALTAAFVALAAKQVCVFFFFIDSAGTITVAQSVVVGNAQAAGYVARAFDWPEVANKACFGALKMETNNAATFTVNATDLAAADVVDTFYNVAGDYGVPVTI